MSVLGVKQSDSFIHIHISILFQILFPFRLLQNIEQSRSLLVIYFLKSFFILLFGCVGFQLQHMGSLQHMGFSSCGTQAYL